MTTPTEEFDTLDTIGPFSVDRLTARQIIWQSVMCHPEWDAIMHYHYLRSEEELNVHAEVVAMEVERAKGRAS